MSHPDPTADLENMLTDDHPRAPRQRPKYSIDEDLGIDYRDCGPWRCYMFASDGNTLEDLLDNASIAEVDQDGGEINCYGLDDASQEARTRALALIEECFK